MLFGGDWGLLLMKAVYLNKNTCMNNVKSLRKMALATVLTVSLCLALSGCQATAKRTSQTQAKTTFYPAAPDKPRLQFLTSISSESDVGAGKKYSALEKLIAGDEERVEKEVIGKPYGLALHEGKLYICDVQKKLVEKLDLRNKRFDYLTKERRMRNPVNLCIEKGRKYIADPIAGKVFVFSKDNELAAILGGDLELKPIDIAVRGKRCYITDMISNQIVVLDILTGEEVMRFGEAGDGPGQFGLIGDIALDTEENIYVTDKGLGRIAKFDKKGTFQKTIGKVGDSIHDFVRPKGIDIDREGRVWVVDSAAEVAKIYNAEGQLLLFFGLPGAEPGNMNLPASISIDYDHVDLFKEHFAEGAQIEFLVLVSNQYGAKINIYGFGSFPLQEKAIEEAASNLDLELEAEQNVESQEAPE
ncbi:MAG: 6-bladed beta-propeller [Planctomycetota bacterium]